MPVTVPPSLLIVLQVLRPCFTERVSDGAITPVGVCDAKWQNLNGARRLVIEWTAQL